MRFRGGAGAGGVRQCRGDRRLRVWAAERGGWFQTGHEAAGPGKGAPGLELDAFLQVPTTERLTPYLTSHFIY